MNFSLQKLGLLILTLFLCATAKAQTPNFIIFLVDDQGWTGTSVQMDGSNPASKSDYYQTPYLETMAANGLTFSQAYAASPKCSPSRAALLTGRTPARNAFTTTDAQTFSGKLLLEGETRTTIDPAWTTTAEWLKATGLNYRTAHYGKWHIGSDGPSSHGFDFSSGETGNDDGNNTGGTAQTDPKKIFSLTGDATEFITNADTDGVPFYLQISHYAVHTDIEATQDRIDLYNDLSERPVGTTHTNSPYGAMTEDLDSVLGAIIDTLTTLGILNNTYIIYTSDNGAATGQSSNSPLFRGKTFIYEGGLRVPFIIQGPGITPNTRSDEPIVGYDLLPTIAALSGSADPLPTDIDGQNIKPIWDGGTFSRTNPLYFHSPHYENNAAKTPRSAIIDGDLKLIVEYETGNKYLYNLNTNIGETTDLYGTNTATATTMLIQLRDYLKSVGAKMPALDETNAAFSGTGTDVDSDNIEDSWEFINLLDYTENDTDDTDGEGATNLEEYNYDSDPLVDDGLATQAASFREVSSTILESLGPASFKMALPFNNNTGSDITVAYTVSGTATSATDFTALSGTVTIPDGTNVSEETVTIIDDTDEESTETIILTLDVGSSSAGVTSGTNTVTTISISDNDCSTEPPLDLTTKVCNDDPTTDGLTELYIETEHTVQDIREMQANSIPNHFYRAPPAIAEISATYLVDLTPSLAGSTTELLGTSSIAFQFGMALNGVRMNPMAAEPFINASTGEENWEWVLDFGGNVADLGGDCNYAHLNNTGEYHYHGDMIGYANTILAGLGDGTTTPTAPVQVGWASDGFPIYYKYGYSDAANNASAIIELQSNYALRLGNRDGDGVSSPCGPYTGRYIADYEYNAANGGHLDECNGRTGVTPEFPGGTYYYVITNDFPVIPRCLMGTPSADFSNGQNGAQLVLPVQLLSFDGVLKNDVTELTWTTAAEENNKGFELYRSVNGEEWELLDFIGGMGTTTEKTTYQYTDYVPSSGENYYKLKQIDFDGKSDFSKIVAITVGFSNSVFDIYPNPTTDKIFYSLVPNHLVEEIVLMDVLGKVVQATTVIDGSLSLQGLSSGVYFLVIKRTNGSLQKKKIVKQ